MSPAPQDIANFAARKAFIDRQIAKSEAACTLVVSILGYGWTPTGRHSLVSHDDEDIAWKQGGTMKVSAVVYNATKDGEKRHVDVIDGVANQFRSLEESLGYMRKL
ncbi:hypothetical protein [Zavarzinella formosa]|uniref:hypothetical protein n=1 Tax=Zavarzinella formosa TaxID=360055 RepID=UPI00035F914D|nr:hypothetical protein [Zavarzinella formosa]